MSSHGSRPTSPLDGTARRVSIVPLGELSDRYRVDPTPVAWGGMGNVWRAYDEDLGRVVAVKSLREELLNDDEARTRLAREIRILARLAHPGVCPVYETFIFEHPPCYAMQWVEGQTLGDAMQRDLDARAGTPERPAAARLFDALLSICDTLAFAHSLGVIHRDVKPANVLLGRFGEVYLMDWGLAKLIGGAAAGDELPVAIDSLETDMGTVIGTPAYAAPEQAQGQIDRVDVRSDVYSVGALLYELLTGVPPYEGNAVVVMTNLATGRLVPPSERVPARRVPPALEAVTLRAMAHDPVDRYPSAEALREALRDALQALEPAASSPSERAGEAGERSRLKDWLMGAAVGALVGGALAAAL